MKKSSTTIFWLSLLVALLAAVYAGAGLFAQGGKGAFLFTNLYGGTVEIYGRGIYHNDSTFRALIFRGTDAVTLFICVPALVFASVLYRRGSLRGHLFLTGMLGYFTYNAASLALGAFYNNLLLVYIGCFSASLFAFILALCSLDLSVLSARTSQNLPRRWIAVFLFVAGLSLMVWVVDIVVALFRGGIPNHLGHYTTEATYTLDLGVILPGVYLTGILVLRRHPLGTLLACVFILLNLTVGLVVAGQTTLQVLNGIVLTPGQFAAYVAPFIFLSLIAAILLVSILRNISEPVG
ncbi:MAG: hypothetical protein WHV66_14905 [Anaerolineales bacterium]|jgi:hypothetical protein